MKSIRIWQAQALISKKALLPNFDKRIVPTNRLFKFEGYFLNDVANALGFDEKLALIIRKSFLLIRVFLLSILIIIWIIFTRMASEKYA